MKKIVSLFQRNYEGDHLVRDEVVLGAEWVINGEGVPTRKFDGACCMIRDGKFYKRHDAKNGKIPPPGFEPAQEPDSVTGHCPGWLRVEAKNENRWFLEGFHNLEVKEDGTYELCGPKVAGNPEGFPHHVLIRHGSVLCDEFERSFEGIKLFLSCLDIEGIVWHHPDGRMVKIKKKDFGFSRRN